MGALIAAAPPLPPVSLAEVKAYLRIGTSEEDALLAGLVRSAAETCEAFTGRLLIARPVEEVLAASTGWTRLGTAPVRSIEGLTALAADGAAEALPADAYAVDIDASGEGWVRLAAPRPEKRIRVAYTAGLAAVPNGIPESVRQGVVRLAAHLYVHRDGAGAGSGTRAGLIGPPAAVTALWRPWRRLRLG